MPAVLLDLIDGKIFCHKCVAYVLPKYIRETSNVCRCSVCLSMIREGSVRRKYQLGFKWCARCQTFRRSWSKRFGWCEDCHSKLRTSAYTKQSKIKRELRLTRY